MVAGSASSIHHDCTRPIAAMITMSTAE